ncbi:MAG: stage III sporulation protein AE [Eubacteriales bacterium]|nr:stage III sporulation protein AE [Eubacteriales bacterium]
MRQAAAAVMGALLLFLGCRAFMGEGALRLFHGMVRGVEVQASSLTGDGEEDAREEQESAGEQETSVQELQKELLTEMDFTEIQNMIDEMLGDSSFSFSEAVTGLLTGEEVFSKEAVQEFLRGLFFSRFEQEKGMFARILLLILLAAVFSNFAAVFENGQIGEISFYVVYLLLFMLLMETFSGMSMSLSDTLSWISQFMKGLAPAYFLAVTASVGTSTAVVFYEGVLLLVWLIQWILLTVFLPAVNLYILIRLVNHLSREEMLGKLAELLNTAIEWGLRSILGLTVGLQVVRSLVTPVMDALKRSALGKTASALPGIGNAVNMVTELVVTSAVLVRNCLGVAFLVVFLLSAAGPVIHYGLMSFGYRFLAAVSQPVSDKRMVECLSTMGDGCALLLRMLFTAEVMCMLTFVILMASFGGGA